jgi:hypothetical protein
MPRLIVSFVSERGAPAFHTLTLRICSASEAHVHEMSVTVVTTHLPPTIMPVQLPAVPGVLQDRLNVQIVAPQDPPTQADVGLAARFK